EARFGDAEHGGYFFTAAGSEHLITRVKEFYDGAAPSGNSVAMLNGLRLARLTGHTDLEATAARVAQAHADVAQAPIAHTFLMTALDWLLGDAHEVVIAGDPDAADTHALVRAAAQTFAPNTVTVLRPTDDAAAVTTLVPYAEAMTPVDGRAAAYVCEAFACQTPVTEPDALRTALDT
ncbi:MAG: thioredoxin domain-containing protein, partial [Bacteroidota bacterium]